MPYGDIREELQKLMVLDPKKFCEGLFELYWNERCGIERGEFFWGIFWGVVYEIEFEIGIEIDENYRE